MGTYIYGLRRQPWRLDGLVRDSHGCVETEYGSKSNPDKTNVMLPRRIKFNELTHPEDWVIENKAAHRQVNPQNTQIDHIIETPEGDVKIRFSQPETSSQNYKSFILAALVKVKDVVSDFYSKMQPPKGISDNIFGTSPSFNLASSSSSVARNIEQPLIKPSIDLDSRFKLNSEEPSGEFLKELMTKLGPIKTNKEKYPKVETSQSSHKHINTIGDIGSESEIEPDKLEQQFITAIGASNSRPPLRNYYTRPTPVDMQLEEKNFSNPSSFNGSSIYEWNLDGMTDYQVITLLQHMLMAANSARNRNLGESEAVIARYLIAGFTGQLRDSEDDHSLELNNIDGDINSSCSSSNHSSDHEDTCHDCNSKTDYYKAILDMNGLSINVITSEESIILDLLDKIDDPEKKKQKSEVKKKKKKKFILMTIIISFKINPDFANDTNIPGPSKEQEILSIDRVVFQKWYVSVKIVISKDFTFEGIALIDSGADLNCIKEGLVPTKYCETTRQALTTANNGRMKINYKISESWVCNDGKMTLHLASSQKPGKGLLPRPNRYNLRKSIGSSSSQPSREAMLGRFENSGYNAHAHCPDIIQIEDEEQDLSPIEVANNYLTNGWAYPEKASGKSRDYYEEILRLTKSAVLTHNFEKPPRHSSKNIELPFQFSKIEILKFITKKTMRN
ncbi:hypothetical protein RJ640_018019 [Escallonia rubra]|uniref:DUF7746 domain-containing protein n=1 Tax=Escallonia rubra TaxID=112253 RepID=A0AA88RJI7_9ASTE|nr:hypothetical protein RJ640_018019 [Escallonia rubra]